MLHFHTIQPTMEASEAGSDGPGGEVESQGQDNQFYQELLSDVPEEHREAVEAAVRKFDGETTKKFQEAADFRKQWEPYQELGITEYEPEAMESLLAFAQLTNDPDTFREWWEAVGDEQGWTDDLYNDLDDDDDEGDEDQGIDIDQLVEALDERFDQKLEPIRTREQQYEESQRLQEANDRIDQQLNEVDPDGKLDDDQVEMVLRLAQTYDDPETSVKQGYEKFLSLVSNTERELLTNKANQPQAAGGEGKASTSAKPVTDWNEAMSMAKERLAHSNTQ